MRKVIQPRIAEALSRQMMLRRVGFSSSLNRNQHAWKARALEAERSLARYKKSLLLETVEVPDKEANSGKSILTREEPKDFSRVIAADMFSEVARKRMIADNGTRIFVAFVAITVAFIYKQILDKREINLDAKEKKFQALQKKHRKDIEGREKSAEDNMKTAQSMFSEYSSTLAKLEVAEKVLKETVGAESEGYRDYKVEAEAASNFARKASLSLGEKQSSEGCSAPRP